MSNCVFVTVLFMHALMNILLWEPGLTGVQKTDMDLRSRENSRVNSFFINCLIT